MKNALIIIIAIAVVAVLVLGSEKVASYVKGGRELVNEQVDKKSPMRLENARIRTMMRDEKQNIAEYEGKLCDLKARQDVAQENIVQLSSELEHEKSVLKRAQDLLEQEKAEYSIGGQAYTYAEVNADAIKRLEECKKLKKDVKFKQSLVRDIDAAIKQGAHNLGESRDVLAKLGNKLERLETRNAHADARTELAKLTGSLSSSSLGVDSEIEKAFHNYEQRVKQKERRASSKLSEANTSHLIDYSADVITDDASKAIDDFLTGNTNDSEAVESTVRKEEPIAAMVGNTAVK